MDSKNRMLGGFTKAFRWRAACALALLYGLCVLAPALAFAFGDSARAIHCLTEDHHSAARLHADHHHAGKAHADHVHKDGTHHQHAKHEGGDGKASPAQCCGFACLSALPVGFADLVSAPIVHAVMLPASHDSVAGRGPDLRYRPPISLLSL